MGIPQDSEHRIKAGIKYILNNSLTDGNVFMPRDELLEKAEETLSVDRRPPTIISGKCR